MSAFTDPGTHELVKLSAHGLLLAVSLVCDGYNLLAWVRRGDPHLAWNVAFYTTVCVYEVRQCLHHCR